MQIRYRHSLRNLGTDLSDGVRKSMMARRLLDAAKANAHWAVKQYVSNVKRIDNLALYQFDPHVAKGVFRQYGVNVHMLDYAVRKFKRELQALNIASAQ